MIRSLAGFERESARRIQGRWRVFRQAKAEALTEEQRLVLAPSISARRPGIGIERIGVLEVRVPPTQVRLRTTNPSPSALHSARRTSRPHGYTASCRRSACRRRLSPISSR